jgi:hypothetical protein
MSLSLILRIGKSQEYRGSALSTNSGAISTHRLMAL